MKNYIKVLFISIIFSLCFCSISYANDNKVVDGQNLLTDAQEAELTKKIEKISSEYNMDIVIVNMPVSRMYVRDFYEYTDLLGDFSDENAFSKYVESEPPKKNDEGKIYRTPQQFANEYYDLNEYGYDEEKSGILYFVSMDLRSYYISTTGKGIDIFERSINYFGDNIISNLKNNDNNSNAYNDSCKQFLEEVEITLGEYKEALEEEDIPEVDFSSDMNESDTTILICVVAGICITMGVIAIVIINTKKKAYENEYIGSKMPKVNKRNYGNNNNDYSPTRMLNEKDDSMLYYDRDYMSMSSYDDVDFSDYSSYDSSQDSSFSSNDDISHGGGGGKF
ncbi:MAG: TPM domain-containing protein [Lachnospiraceae bacterium]|nr:TPM domain-containing protein [Lachnospiraceae bacterium]